MKICITEAEPWEYPSFDPLKEQHELVFSSDPLSLENVDRYAEAEILSPFIYSKLSEDVLGRMTNLKMIATRSTGFDHIASDYCRRHHIIVCNVPTYGKNTVAEHVFGLLLAISHKLFDAIDRTRRGDFSQRGLQGFDLLGKTIGVVGTGDIGEHVIRIASGFQMNVLAFDVNPKKELAEKLSFKFVELDELLSQSDVITLHVPANPKTHHMISHNEFDKMKPGAVLINTARGTVVDNQALVRAISTGKIKAAGLDVLAEEPAIREEAELLRSIFNKEHDLSDLLVDHILLRMRNVLVTPHSAFNTREAVERILGTTVGNMEAFISGKPRNVVID